jgi:ribonuclease D
MSLYQKDDEILREIKNLKSSSLLWMDTEIADYMDPKKARLSLIQILPAGKKVNENSSYEELVEQVIVFDVLDQELVIETFINEIMKNEKIEKVFHNKSFDLRYLGKDEAKNCKCTLLMANSIPYHILPVKNRKLGTLVEFFDTQKKVSKTEQTSDWAIRPLSEDQVKYAMLDPVYLYIVDINLTPIQKKMEKDVQKIGDLEKKLFEMEESYQKMNSEYNYLKSKLKDTMISEKIYEGEHFKISFSDSNSCYCSFKTLMELVSERGVDLDFEFYCNENIKKEFKKHKLDVEMIENKKTVEKILKK